MRAKFSLQTAVPGGSRSGTNSLGELNVLAHPHLQLTSCHMLGELRLKLRSALNEGSYIAVYLGSSENVLGVWMYISACTPTSESATLNPQRKVPPTPQKRKGNLLPQCCPLGRHQTSLNASLCFLQFCAQQLSMGRKEHAPCWPTPSPLCPDPQQAFLLTRDHTRFSTLFLSPQQLSHMFSPLTPLPPLDLVPISLRK